MNKKGSVPLISVYLIIMFSRSPLREMYDFFIFLLKIEFESSELPELSQVHRRDRANTGRGNFMHFVLFEIFGRVVIS